MTVGLVGSGPAAAAVEAALADVETSVERVDGLDADHRLGVVVAQAGAATLERANERALDADLPWFAVELGGIGGYPVVDAAVIGLASEGACYECLRGRVGSNVDPDAEPHAAPADATARFAGAVAGHRTVQWLRGEDVLGRIVELPHAERELLPVPNCVCGGERDRTVDREYVDRDLERTLAGAERALDDRVGVVHDVGEAESYPAPYYLAQLCDTEAFADASASRQAAGVDAGWDAAFMKALGEGLERYCAGVYRTAEFESGSVADVEDAVAPSSFVTPGGFGDAGDASGSDEPGAEALDGAERSWVPGTDLSTGDAVHLPAELVHYPPPERTIRPAITTGLGLGNSTVDAVLSGLYEALERDAAAIAWYSTYEPLELVVEDEQYQRLAARAGAEDLDATLLLLTQDVDVPVVAAVLQRESWPAFAVGTAAHLDPVRAARDALAEGVQNWFELRGMGPDAVEDASGAIGRYAGDPPARFTSVDSRIPASAIGPETVPSGIEHLQAVLDRVDEADMTPYAARTTTRDVASLGFESVRALVPSAQPLFFDDPFFGERARRVPADLGFEPTLDRDHHPYP